MPLVKHPRSPFWWYDFRFQGKRYRASTGEKSRQAASTVEAAALTRLTLGSPHTRTYTRPPTLREFSERFLAWSENSRTLKPNTRKFYAYGWRLLAFSPLASMPIDQITAEIIDCTAFRRPIMDRVSRQPTGSIAACSPSYTNQALRTLKVMLGLAEDWNLIGRRPRFTAAASPGRDCLIQPADEAALERELGGSNFQAWLVVLILQDTGMRPSEVFSIRLEDVYWAERRIWIPAGKSAKARRFVGMTERMHEMLSTWSHGAEQGWLFPSKSRSGHLESIYTSFNSARKRAGLDRRIVPYAARHTFGTHGMRATGNAFAVMKQMGHASLRSMEPYQHQEIDTLLAAVNQRNANRTNTVHGHTFGRTSPTIQ